MLFGKLRILVRNISLLALVCFSVFKIHAQTTVTIGTGTSSDYSNPFETYFNYGWSSQLYLASELGAAGTINSIAYYVTNSSSSYTLDNQKIYVRQTSLSSFPDKNYPTTTGFTLVYSGSITFGTSGWKTISFTTPFSYNGTDNLEVLVESRDGSTFTSAVQSRYTSQAGGSIYRTKYDYNDYSFPSTYNAGGRVQHYSNAQFVINTCTYVGGTSSATTSTVCSGGSSTLNLSGQTAGQAVQWQSSTDNITFTDIQGATTSPFVLTSITASKYYRARVGSGSCIVNSSVTNINVTAIPTAPTASNNGPVCVGTTLGLFASTISNATYSWTGPNGYISSLQNPTVSTSATSLMGGTYGVKVTVNGCSSAITSTIVTVNSVPTVPTVSNNGPVCVGGSLNLTSSTQAGASYAWTGPNGFTSTSQNPIVSTSATILMGGTYSLTTTVNGCISNASSTTVVVNTLPIAPTVSNNGPVCVGSSLNLTANTIAGASYAWTGPNGFTSSLQNSVVNTQADTTHRGTYTLVVSLNGCTSSAQTTAVVNTYPSTLAVTASNLRIQAGESTTLTASGVTNYTWDSNLGTGSVKVVSPTQTTTYTVSGDNGYACVAQEAITIDVVNPTNTVVNSETVSIGTGTATDYNVPLQTYFNYGWSSQLYLASEIRGAGYLNSLSFYTVNSGSSYTLENQKVYVRHTQESSFADKYYPTTTGFTLVYSGPVTITSSGWLTIPFSSAFNYNGTSNLEVLVESRDGSTFTSAIQTRYTKQLGTSIYRTKFDYNNDEFPTNYNQGGRLQHYATVQFTKTVCNLTTPVITTNSPICEGGKLNLSATPVVGANYMWSGPGDFESSLNSPVLTTVNSSQSGVYTVLLKIEQCEISTNVNVLIEPNVATQTFHTLELCSNELVEIGVTSETTSNYQWDNLDDDLCDTCSKISFIPKLTSYTLRIVNAKNCSTEEVYQLNYKLSVTLNINQVIDNYNQKNILTCFGAKSYQCHSLVTNEVIIGENNKFEISPKEDAKYVIKGDNTNGCFGYDTLDLIGFRQVVRPIISQPFRGQKGSIHIYSLNDEIRNQYYWKDLPESFDLNQSNRDELSPELYELYITDSLYDTLDYQFLLAEYLDWNTTNPSLIRPTNHTLSKLVSETNCITTYSRETLSSTSKGFIGQTIHNLASSYQFGLIGISDTLKASDSTIQYGFSVSNKRLSLIVAGETQQFFQTIKENDVLLLRIETGLIHFTINGKTLLDYTLSTTFAQQYVVQAKFCSLNGTVENIQYYNSILSDNAPEIVYESPDPIITNTISLNVSIAENDTTSLVSWMYPNGQQSTTHKIDNLYPGLYKLRVSVPSYVHKNQNDITTVPYYIDREILVGYPSSINNENGIEYQNSSYPLKIATLPSDYNSGNYVIDKLFDSSVSSWVSFVIPDNLQQEYRLRLTNKINPNQSIYLQIKTEIVANQIENSFTIVQSTQPILSGKFAANDAFTIERFNSNINFYKNSVLIGSLADLITDYYTFDVSIKYPNTGIKDLTLSRPNLGNELLTQYSVLQKTIEGNFIKVIGNQLRFKYEEEYIDNSSLSYLIYMVGTNKIIGANLGNSTQALNYGAVIQTKNGSNFYSLDLCFLKPNQGDFILEVFNSKNEKQYLRFKYNPTASESSLCNLEAPIVVDYESPFTNTNINWD